MSAPRDAATACGEALGELDGALEELLSTLDAAGTEGDEPRESARSRTDACFAAFKQAFESSELTAETLPTELRARLEEVLAKYALAANLAQRLRTDLATELTELRSARHRIRAAQGPAATGEECNVHG